MSIDDLREKFTAASYGELAEEMISTARQTVAITREKTGDDAIAIGASKLGGWPDLPAGVEWPMIDGRGLAFLGQFALADVPVAEGEASMPRRGLLSIFYDYAEQPWGSYPGDRDGWQVLYWENAEGLERAEPPAGAYSDDPEYDRTFQACRVGFEMVTTYRRMGYDIYGRETPDELIDLFEETLHVGQGDKTPHHQFFGHPFVVQNPMEEECQLVSNGIYSGNELSAEDEKRAESLIEGVKDWTLLLQLDTDYEPRWMWGDGGILYFWIRRQDLEAGEFGKGWCILQCG